MPARGTPVFCIGTCLKLLVATVHKQDDDIFVKEVL
jgi:hypothetical protein